MIRDWAPDAPHGLPRGAGPSRPGPASDPYRRPQTRTECRITFPVALRGSWSEVSRQRLGTLK